MGNCCETSETRKEGDGERRNEGGYDNPVMNQPKPLGDQSVGSKRNANEDDGGKDNYFLIQTCHGHDKAINCMALSADESVLATGSDDGTVRIWTTKSVEVECIGVCCGHEDYITCITFQDDFLLSGSADNTIRRWDIHTCECIATFKGHQALVYKVICIGDQLLSSSYDRTVRMWDLEKAIEIRRYTGHQRGVYPMIYINLRDLDSTSPVRPTNVLMQGEREPHVLVTGSADSTAKMWSVDSGRCMRTFAGHENAVTCMTCDSTGSTLFTGSLDGQIRSWRMATSEPLLVFEGHQGAIIHLQTVAKILYSSSADRTVRAWVSETAINTRVYKGHKKSITAFKVHKGFLYTASGDSVGQIYSAKTAVLQRTLDGHKSPITCLVVVNDHLFTGSLDKTLKVWDASCLEEGFTVDSQNKIDPKKQRDRRLKAKAKLLAQQQVENDRPSDDAPFVEPGTSAAAEQHQPAEGEVKKPALAKVNLAKRIKKNTNMDEASVEEGNAYDYGQRERQGADADVDRPKATEKKSFPGAFGEEMPSRQQEKPKANEKKSLFGADTPSSSDKGQPSVAETQDAQEPSDNNYSY